MKHSVSEGLTFEEDQTLQKILSKWETAGAGTFSDDTFIQLSHVLPTVGVEVEIFRKNTFGELEVIGLDREAENDPWKGLIHTPGKIFRASDYGKSKSPERLALERIFMNELEIENPSAVEILISHTQFLSFNNLNTRRGGILVLIYYLDLTPFLYMLKKPVQWIPVIGLSQKSNYVDECKQNINLVLNSKNFIV